MIVHGIDYPGTTIGEGITEQAGMEQAHYYWDPVIAPSGLAFTPATCFRSGRTACLWAHCAANSSID